MKKSIMLLLVVVLIGCSLPYSQHFEDKEESIAGRSIYGPVYSAVVSNDFASSITSSQVGTITQGTNPNSIIISSASGQSNWLSFDDFIIPSNIDLHTINYARISFDYSATMMAGQDFFEVDIDGANTLSLTGNTTGLVTINDKYVGIISGWAGPIPHSFRIRLTNTSGYASVSVEISRIKIERVNKVSEYYSPSASNHTYCAYEKEYFVSRFPSYRFNGLLGYIRAVTASDTVSWYEYYSSSGGGTHYYSISSIPPSGFRYNAVLNYVYSSPGVDNDRLRIVEYYNRSTNDHCYSSLPIDKMFPGWIDNSGGSAIYVYKP